MRIGISCEGTSWFLKLSPVSRLLVHWVQRCKSIFIEWRYRGVYHLIIVVHVLGETAIIAIMIIALAFLCVGILLLVIINVLGHFCLDLLSYIWGWLLNRSHFTVCDFLNFLDLIVYVADVFEFLIKSLQFWMWFDIWIQYFALLIYFNCSYAFHCRFWAIDWITMIS